MKYIDLKNVFNYDQENFSTAKQKSFAALVA